jgi:peptidoglycan/LPS O-acetylase OafA/YrhL
MADKVWPEQAPGNARLANLDALRGLAAMAVVVSHALHVLPAFGTPHFVAPDLATHGGQGPGHWLIAAIRHTPLFTLVDGHAAVMLFFVLSGLVLARPLLGPSPPSYSAFVRKRVARLYPPYAAAILLAALAQAFVGSLAPHGPSAWLAQNWTDRPGGGVVLDYTLMLGRSVALDNPVWSLDWEMRLSLLLPLLFWPLRYRAGLAPPLMVVALLFGGEAMRLQAQGWAATLAASLAVYGGMFVLGATMSLHLATLRRLALSLPRGVPELAAWAILWLNWRESMLALGAAVLIAAALGRGPLAWLCARPACQFLGRISYSLYLVHVPVLMVLLALTAGYLPQAAMVAVMPPVAIAVAWAFYRVVEAPSHRLAHGIRPGPGRGLPFALEPACERT